MEKPKETGLDAGILSYETKCPVCALRTWRIHRKKTRVESHTSWEHESIMRLLGVDSVESQMRFCPRCFHFFHFPLFDESSVYGKSALELRTEVYENKYFPGRSYDEKEYYHKGWYAKNREIFLYISHIFSHVIRNAKVPGHKTSPKILDWGGGDGYLVETISLVSKKVLRSPCEVYCFDYHEWEEDSHSPYFKYINKDGLKKKGPFDIIFLSHVLEHVSSPTKLLAECFNNLSRDGIMVVYVPFQQYSALLPKTGLLEYHQQLFSVASLREALKKSGFKNISVKLYQLSYRGNKGSHLLATANTEGRLFNGIPLKYVEDIYNFKKTFFRVLFRKIRDRIIRKPSTFRGTTRS